MSTDDIGLNWDRDLREDRDMRLLLEIEVWEERADTTEEGEEARGVETKSELAVL